jgi:hypothetical protein
MILLIQEIAKCGPLGGTWRAKTKLTKSKKLPFLGCFEKTLSNLVFKLAETKLWRTVHLG